MMFSNTFLASANRISQRCRNPGRVLEAMRHTMSQTTKLQNACYVADLLGDLTRKRVPDTFFHVFFFCSVVIRTCQALSLYCRLISTLLHPQSKNLDWNGGLYIVD